MSLWFCADCKEMSGGGPFAYCPQCGSGKVSRAEVRGHEQGGVEASVPFPALQAQQSARTALLAEARALLEAKRYPYPCARFWRIGTEPVSLLDVGYINALRSVLRRLVESEGT